uniref:Uncharacterized protein n=1 Tax=Pyxicephalus adspersus TaxID=30357 RepID=A0A499QIJ4_PYXAD|nr:hypothetical protein maker-66O13-exonerate_protein2genome-gene-0.7 [Pyxicephalus adspersus]
MGAQSIPGYVCHGSQETSGRSFCACPILGMSRRSFFFNGERKSWSRSQ